MKSLIALSLVFNFAFADILTNPAFYYMPGNIYNNLGKIADSKQEVQQKENQQNVCDKREEPQKAQDVTVDGDEDEDDLVFVCLAFLFAVIALIVTGI